MTIMGRYRRNIFVVFDGYTKNAVSKRNRKRYIFIYTPSSNKNAIFIAEYSLQVFLKDFIGVPY